MATKTKKSPGTEITTWDKELAKQANVAAGMEASASGGGQFFSLKSGVLSFGGNPFPRNEMAVIILDTIMENVFYEGEYDPDVPQGPTCFAFDRDEKVMKPHIQVVEAGNSQAGASGLCQGCEMNEWGSAGKGRGKACRNTRRLAMIPAGDFDKKTDEFTLIGDLEHYQHAEIAYMKLPVTSVKSYSTFVKQVAETLKRPPHGIVARVFVVPDAKSQFKVLFEALMKVPDDVMGAVMKRHEEAKSGIDFPYRPFEEEEKSTPHDKAKGKVLPPPKGKTRAGARSNRKY